MTALGVEARLGSLLVGVCVVSERACSPPAPSRRYLASHPGTGRPAHPPRPLPLLSLPAPVVRAGQVRPRQ
jgi:hypothetical protein